MKKHGILWLAAIASALVIPAAWAEEDPCPATAAKGVITELVYKSGQVVASGTWEVNGGANGAILEFRIDNDRFQAEIRTGASGTWSFIQSYRTCDRPLHSFRVHVYPLVPEGEGRQRVCLSRYIRSEQVQFQFPCGAQVEIDLCSWSCEDGHCAGYCAVTATHGKLPYFLFRGAGDPKDPQVGVSPDGAWTIQLVCKRGEKVSFYTRDNYGRGRPSPPAERICGEE